MRGLKLRTIGVLSLQLTASAASALLPSSSRRANLPDARSTSSSFPTSYDGYSYTELESGVRIYGQSAAAQARDSTGHLLLGERGGSTSSSAQGWCQNSSLENDGSDNSPLVTDCTVIATQVYALADPNNGYFGRGECGADSGGIYTCYYPVVSYGTCMFGASTVDSDGGSVRIGWADVGDLITSSVLQFGGLPSLLKVGASGEMACPEEVSADQMYTTGWGIYHS